MGTNIYGSYDELVIELHGLDVLRARRREVRVRIDDVWRVRAAAVRTLVSWDGERVLRLGNPGRRRALVLDLVPGATLDRVVVGIHDADEVAGDLCRWGVGGLAPPAARREPALVAG